MSGPNCTSFKILTHMRFDCIPPEFSPFRNLKKNIGKLNSLTVRKKKKIGRPTQFSNFGRVRAMFITIFLGGPNHSEHSFFHTFNILNVSLVYILWKVHLQNSNDCINNCLLRYLADCTCISDFTKIQIQSIT